MLAAVHLSPYASITGALLLGLLMLWQMGRASAPGTPRSRSWIRWCSMTIRFLMLGPFVWGLSFVDASVDPRGYMLTWGIAVLLLLLSVVAVAADVFNNLRLQVERQEELDLDLLRAALKHAPPPEGQALPEE